MLEISAWRTSWRKWTLLLLLAALMPLVASGCGGDDEEAAPPAEEEAPPAEEPAEEEEEVEQRTLRLVSFLPSDHTFTRPTVPRWIELVEEKSNGSLTVEYVGGPESVPTEDQFGGVVRGTVDVGFNVPTFYLDLVPAGNTMHLSPFTPAEERDNGYFDFLDRIHQEAGVRYLGRWISVSPFFIWSNERVSSLDDLRGKRLRSTTTYEHILTALGVRPVNIVPPEVFTALQRGLVDGFAFPLLGPRDTGWLEVTQFLIAEPFYNQNGAIIINPESFDGLADSQKQALEEATRQFEDEIVDMFLDLNREEWAAVQDLVEIVELPQEESDRLLDLWYEETWDALIELWGASEEDIEEAKDLLDYEGVSGNPERIRQVPCAPAGDAAADEPFCPVGR